MNLMLAVRYPRRLLQSCSHSCAAFATFGIVLFVNKKKSERGREGRRGFALLWQNHWL